MSETPSEGPSVLERRLQAVLLDPRVDKITFRAEFNPDPVGFSAVLVVSDLVDRSYSFSSFHTRGIGPAVEQMLAAWAESNPEVLP
jgi:hypothetical protein